MNYIINSIVMNFASILSHVLLPGMTCVFAAAVSLRVLVYYTVRRELWFVREFEKRLYSKLDGETEADSVPFHIYLRKVLEKTFYEVFELRSRYRRRNPDFIMSLSDRMFLVQDGAARLIHDTLKYLRYDGYRSSPEMIEVSKNVFNSNPAFSRIFGIMPASACNTLLNLAPGLFIIGGIFGTFVGIMTALPRLSEMELTNPEQTKLIMDAFLASMSHALVSSSLGIMLSVSLSVLNSLFDPEGLFLVIVDRYSSALTVLWTRCQGVTPGSALMNPTDEDFATDEELDAHEAVERQLAHSERRHSWREGMLTPRVFQPPRLEGSPAPTDDAAGGTVGDASVGDESEAGAASGAVVQHIEDRKKKSA